MRPSRSLICLVVTGLSRCAWHTLPSVRAVSLTVPVSQGVPRSLWKLGRLNHVAIAVPDLEKATALYRDVLGAQVSATVPLPEHGVYTVFVELGNTKLELLHPLGEKSPIAGFLQKNKAGGMHHICIEVKIRLDQCYVVLNLFNRGPHIVQHNIQMAPILAKIFSISAVILTVLLYHFFITLIKHNLTILILFFKNEENAIE